MKYSLIIALCFVSFFVMGQEKMFTISGRVSIDKRVGDVYVFLVTEHGFEIPMSGIDTLIFPVNYDKIQVDFRFENVLPGTYGISSYQDVNGNKKFDKFIFGPREPWAFSYIGEMKYPPNFNDISFTVGSDVRVNLELGR